MRRCSILCGPFAASRCPASPAKSRCAATCPPRKTPLYVRSVAAGTDRRGRCHARSNTTPKALIYLRFCSLRLSVRTPPFHGGESGSIPLGSAKHVATTFKAQADHFQGLREPFSQPKFHPLHNSANGHQRARMRDRKNGYGRYCNHNLRRALSRTPPHVAGLLSARYLTTPPHEARGSCAGTENCQARSPSSLTRQRPLKNKLATKQGYPDVPLLPAA